MSFVSSPNLLKLLAGRYSCRWQYSWCYMLFYACKAHACRGSHHHPIISHCSITCLSIPASMIKQAPVASLRSFRGESMYRKPLLFCCNPNVATSWAMSNHLFFDGHFCFLVGKTHRTPACSLDLGCKTTILKR